MTAGPAPAWVDAMTVKVCEDGRVVNADGHREILGLDVASAEDGAGWLAVASGSVAVG